MGLQVKNQDSLCACEGHHLSPQLRLRGPSPPNLPPPSLHSLSLTSCQPSRAHYPGMQFPSLLLCSSDLFFFFSLIYHHRKVLHKVFATQSQNSEFQGQKVMLCLRQFLLSSSTIKHNLSPNVSKTEVCKMLTATNGKYLSNYTSFTYINFILGNLYQNTTETE